MTKRGWRVSEAQTPGWLGGRVVFDDQVKRQMLGRLPVEEPQQAAPLGVAAPRLARRDDVAVERVERGEQSRRAVALVVVHHGVGAPSLHRQARLGAVERLYLPLLVATEDERAHGRVELEPDVIERLVPEVRVAEELEGEASDRRRPEPRVDGQLGVLQFVALGGISCSVNWTTLDRASASMVAGRPERVASWAQRSDSAFQEALSPDRDLPSVRVDLGADLGIPQIPGSQKHDVQALLQPRLDAVSSRNS